jgi:hypothetical protein
VIRAIRALLLICCLSAVVAAAMFARTFNSLEAAERAILPVVSATIVDDINGVQDPLTLKALCVDLAKGVKAESMEREARYRSFLSLTRHVAKWALGFSAVSAVVLLAAWLILGRAAMELRKATMPA